MPHDNYALVPHTHEPALLLLQSAEGWTLPHLDAIDTVDINASIKAQLGYDTTVLYCAYDRYKDDEREEQHLVYVLENHSPDFLLPSDGRWISKTDLATVELAVTDHRAVLEQWFNQTASTMHSSQRVPWAYARWFDSATGWIQEQMTTFGLARVGPIEQVLVSLWSTVLSIPTTTETLYFKASAPVFAYEPELTWKLSNLVPTYTPPVLVIDAQRHWMLMHDAGIPLSELEEKRTDPAYWEKVLRHYAHMQLQLLGQQETLLTAGCPDRRLDILPTLLEDALRDTSLLLLDQEKGLPENECVQLQTSLPQVRALCAELKGHGIPETLHHDDLHGRNILIYEEEPIFFDWAESAITHPFCSLVIVERVFRYVLEFPAETITYLRECYLQEWTQFEPMKDLRVAYDLAQQIGKLCRALTWGRVLAHLSPEERQEYETAFPYWLRVFLGTEE